MAATFFLSAVFNVIVLSTITHGAENTNFPNGFLIGTASSAYQVEGAWNISGKGENVWDKWTHEYSWLISDRSNGDVACDSYHKYNEDIQLLADLGVDYYRFSLSWSRILPTGLANVVSEDGIKYYKNLIDGLLAKGIQPLVSLYHWDHPQFLEEMGGWTNVRMVEWFGEYARVVFRELGPKVKYFATINEPTVVCNEGYEGGTKAPGKLMDGIGLYLCMHNILKAHARAYHIYDDEFRKEQNGKISIVIPCAGAFAKHSNDTEAEDLYFQYRCGWTAHPIFSKAGDYPEIMKTRIAENSKAQGYSRSRLPEFNAEWIKYIRGTADYFSLNHYTSTLVETIPRMNGTPWWNDIGIRESQDPKWPKTASKWLRVVPAGFAKVLRKIKSEYDNPPVYVLENGVSDNGGIDDRERINYLYSYMKSMLSAVYDDGCNVKSYTVWSILDNFEWERGYSEKFGIVRVDFDSPNRTRTPKMSMSWLKNVIRTRNLLPEYPNPEVVNVV